jgi:ABC-type antimicrobial peptide transport system permease subunit
MVAYAVAQRRREISMVALGASRGRVVGLIMGETSRLFVVGAAIGGTLAMIGARSTEALLFGLQPNDPLTLAAAGAILALGAAVASYLPARRAAGLDPLIALHQD